MKWVPLEVCGMNIHSRESENIGSGPWNSSFQTYSHIHKDSLKDVQKRNIVRSKRKKSPSFIEARDARCVSCSLYKHEFRSPVLMQQKVDLASFTIIPVLADEDGRKPGDC